MDIGNEVLESGGLESAAEVIFNGLDVMAGAIFYGFDLEEGRFTNRPYKQVVLRFGKRADDVSLGESNQVFYFNFEAEPDEGSFGEIVTQRSSNRGVAAI